MQTDVVESAEPTDALASFGGKLGQRQFAETVMGVIGGHGYHLMGNQFSSFYTNSPQKGSKIRKKFLYVLCKREKRLLFGRERAIMIHRFHTELQLKSLEKILIARRARSSYETCFVI